METTRPASFSQSIAGKESFTQDYQVNERQMKGFYRKTRIF